MRWLLPRVLPIVIILIAAIGAAVLIGRAEPIPPNVAMFHLQDCQLPCWIGIIPGKTTIEDARKIIEKVYGPLPVEDEDGDGLYLIVGNNDRSIGVSFNDGIDALESDTVEKIDLSEYEGQQYIEDPMGQVSILLGQPNFVAEWGGEGTAFQMLEYSKPHVVLGFGIIRNAGDPIPTCTEVSPNLPYLGIEIYDAPPDTMYQSQPWQGFKRCYNLG